MERSRRSVLRATGIGSVLAITGLAGCLEDVENAIGGSGTPGYAKWLYDPSELLDADYLAFGTMSIADVYDNREKFPDTTVEQIESANEAVDAVDLADLEDAVGMGFGQPSQQRGGGSLVVTGEYDADAIEDRIEEEADSQNPVETEDYGEYTLYTTTQQPASDGGGAMRSFTLGVSSQNLVLAGMADDEVTSTATAKTAIDAGAGDATSLAAADDTAKEVLEAIGTTTLAVGMTVDADLANLVGEGNETRRDAVDDLEGVGLSSHLEGETVVNETVLVYADGDSVPKDAVEDLIEEAREDNEDEDPLEEVSVTQDGRTLVVRTEGDVEEFFDVPIPGGGGSSPTPAPRVAFDFEYSETADGTSVGITHVGGDTIQSDRTIVNVEGQTAFIGGEVRSPFTAGTNDWDGEITAGTALEFSGPSSAIGDGATVRIVWRGEEGEVTLARSTVRT